MTNNQIPSFAAHSFIELVEHLFSRPEIRGKNIGFLSNRLCQDPLENFFGAQRQRGATCDNPSVSEFLTNTQALRVVNSFCSGPVRGNCRGVIQSGKTAEGSSVLQQLEVKIHHYLKEDLDVQELTELFIYHCNYVYCHLLCSSQGN